MRAAVLQRAYRSAPLLLSLAVLGWSGNFVVGRLVGGAGGEGVPPTTLAFLRWLIAALVLTPIGIRHVRTDRAALLASWRTVLVLSITGVAVFNAFVYHGLQTTPAINALLLQSICPVLILVVGFLRHRERPLPAQLGGLVVSLLGVWIVVSRGAVLRADALGLTGGDAWILAAVASYAVYTVALRGKPGVHPVSLLLVTFVIGALILAPFALAEALAGDRMPASTGAVAAVAYVALIPSIGSYFCFNRGVELIGGARAGQYIHLMPVFGAALAFVVLGESLAPYHLAGAAAIAAGIWLAARTA